MANGPFGGNKPAKPQRTPLQALVYWGTVLGIWGLIFVVAFFAVFARDLPDTSTLYDVKRQPSINYLDRSGALLAVRGSQYAPPVDLDGPTEGILVMTTTNPALDTVTRAVTALWMPWQGKRFDSEAGTGDNRLTKSTGLVGKLLWPLYSMRDAESGKLAFDFATYVEAGKDDPDRQVMVIDYANVESNPRLVIRSIRDELVQLVPGVYLGKILFNTGSDKYSKIGYFALRTPR